MSQQRPTASKQPQPSGNRRPPRSASRRKRARRREAELRRTTGASRPRWVWIGGGAAAAVVVLAVVLAVVLTRPHSATHATHPSAGPTPVPSALASAESSASGSPVAGVSCDPSAPTSPSTPTPTPATAPARTYAHLAIYVNGEARRVPAGIGVGPPRTTYSTDAGPYVSGNCYYWLNTRTYDGVIHVQPPSQASLTLGAFFDIWGQQLSATQVGPASGTVTVLVNGSQYSGDPRAVPLSSHAVIQLNVGTNVPFQHYVFPAGE